MKKLKYILLLVVSSVLYMLYTSSLLVNQWLADQAHRPPGFTLQTEPGKQSSLPSSLQTIGQEDLDGILFDGQVGCRDNDRSYYLLMGLSEIFPRTDGISNISEREGLR